MPINITMPALSPTMEEGNLAKWLVKEGDNVAPGDVIAEIETDKATMEVEAVDEGTVAKLVVPAGTEGVKVNTRDRDPRRRGRGRRRRCEGWRLRPRRKRRRRPKRKHRPRWRRSRRSCAKPLIPCRTFSPRGRGEGSRPQRGRPPRPVFTGRDSERTFASPLARRIAKDAGVDVAAIAGSGPHGRVVKATSRRRSPAAAPRRHRPSARRRRSRRAADAPAALPAPRRRRCRTTPVLKCFAEGSYELVPHDNMRKTIARASSRRRDDPAFLSHARLRDRRAAGCASS
jgi:pyruvate dehydrogenase E2 component (dihydrolipoamide acetyltransferase)